MNNIIHESVKMGKDAKIGNFTTVMEDVKLGENVVIGNCVTVYPGTVIGNNVIVGDNCVIGRSPVVAKASTLKKRGDLTGEKLPSLVMGDCITVGSSAVLYCGTTIADNVFIADLASIRENCRIGNNVIVGRGVTIENQCTIGAYTKLQAEAYLTALSEVGENVFIAPTVSTTNDNFMGRTEERFKHRKGATIKKGARIGGNAVLLPGVTVSEDAVVGAGSVVTKDIPERMVAYGNPAKVQRETPKEQLLEAQK
ncbi:MAG: DapH/DapD/GlmU-related protein [Armatimonadota bacterium]